MAELDGAKGASLLHAHEDVIDAKALGSTGPFQSRTNDLLMAEGFAFDPGNPLQRDLAISRIAFDPVDVLGGALPENGFGNDGLFAHLLEEDHDVAFGPEEIQVTIDHNAIEGVINELNPGRKELNQELHRRPSPGRVARVVDFTAADATPDPPNPPERLKNKIFEISQQPIRRRRLFHAKTRRIGCWEISNIFG
jgi:hypothetical protein